MHPSIHRFSAWEVFWHERRAMPCGYRDDGAVICGGRSAGVSDMLDFRAGDVRVAFVRIPTMRIYGWNPNLAGDQNRHESGGRRIHPVHLNLNRESRTEVAAGYCPAPAIASLIFDGATVLLGVAPALKKQMNRVSNRGNSSPPRTRGHFRYSPPADATRSIHAALF